MLVSRVCLTGSAREGSGIPVYAKKIRQNTQNSSKYTQNYTQVYFIPEIQRKWYTEYPYLSCNIPHTRFKKPLYTVYPKTLADPGLSIYVFEIKIEGKGKKNFKSVSTIMIRNMDHNTKVTQGGKMRLFSFQSFSR